MWKLSDAIARNVLNCRYLIKLGADGFICPVVACVFMLSILLTQMYEGAFGGLVIKKLFIKTFYIYNWRTHSWE